jgi:hypothetical protein
VSYTRNYRRTTTQASARGSEPTPRQLSYLTVLIERSGQTEEQWRESVGLYEHSAWGRRLRTETITRARVSAWISDLRASQGTRPRGRCEDAPCCGCCD